MGSHNRSLIEELSLIVLHATIAIAAVVALIIVLRIDPVISLVVGSLYLGLASGLGLEKTITAIVDGFGRSWPRSAC